MTLTVPWVPLLPDDYAIMCNLPRRGGSDSLRERPRYEYGIEGPEDPAEPYISPYWDYANPAGPYDVPESVPLFNDNDYSPQQPPVRVPIHRPREHQPRPEDSYSGRCMHPSQTRKHSQGVLSIQSIGQTNSV